MAQARRDADEDIAEADRFVTLMTRGIREFEFFNKDTDRRTKIATLAQMVEMAVGPVGAVIVAATAIELLAGELGPIQ